MAAAEAQLKLGRLFGPMLERRDRSDRLRKMLTFYDQNKFFFNLPASLKAAIDRVRSRGCAGPFAQAILTSPLRWFSTTTTTTTGRLRARGAGRAPRAPSRRHRPCGATAGRPVGAKPTFVGLSPACAVAVAKAVQVADKIWAEANRLIADLRRELEGFLHSPTASLDVQERVVQYDAVVAALLYRAPPCSLVSPCSSIGRRD